MKIAFILSTFIFLISAHANQKAVYTKGQVIFLKRLTTNTDILRYKGLAQIALQQLSRKLLNTRSESTLADIASKLKLNWEDEDQGVRCGSNAIACAGKGDDYISITNLFYLHLEDIENTLQHDSWNSIFPLEADIAFHDHLQNILLHEMLHIVGYQHSDLVTTAEMDKELTRIRVKLKLADTLGPVIADGSPKTSGFSAYLKAQFPLWAKSYIADAEEHLGKTETLQNTIPSNAPDSYVSYEYCSGVAPGYGTVHFLFTLVQEPQRVSSFYKLSTKASEVPKTSGEVAHFLNGLIDESHQLPSFNKPSLEFSNDRVEFKISEILDGDRRKFFFKHDEMFLVGTCQKVEN